MLGHANKLAILMNLADLALKEEQMIKLIEMNG
jgi:hypothetical protein